MSDAPTTIVATLLVSDLVDSTKLVERLGDIAAAELLSRHDRVARDLMTRFSGTEVDRTDGFLIRFDRPVDAVRYALAYHRALDDLDVGDRSPPARLEARIGIHLGEVVVKPGARAVELDGLAKPMTARIAGLAGAGQTLLTRGAFDLARRGGIGTDDLPPELTWLAHGPYRLQGVDESIDVFEVGVPERAPLSPPADGPKARRAVTPGDESTLGWRPARGLEVPGRVGWTLAQKLGEGGFGEVWLAEHRSAHTSRVFKFCFDADRLRSLKRELTLFRILQHELGARDDIATLYEVRLDEPPFFLETEYASGGSLPDWCATRGGVEAVPLEVRLAIVARVARAVAAAHSVGILHKDVKPANVLIDDRDGVPLPRLADFGIGTLAPGTSPSGVTMAGFTEVLAHDEASHTGTLLYAPPETAAGRMFTVAGDVYALGVMLYQMVVGDLGRPLASGWPRDIADPLLRTDIAACVDADADRRPGARDLAEALDELPARRRRWRRRRIARIGSAALVVTTVVLGVVAVWGLREASLRSLAEDRRDEATETLGFMLDVLSSADPWDSAGGDVRVVDRLDRAAQLLETSYTDRPRVRASLHLALGRTYRQLSRFDDAERQLGTALRLLESSPGTDRADIATAHHEYGAALYRLARFDEALTHYETALARRRELVAESPSDSVRALALAETATHLAATVARDDARLAEAMALAREALRIRRAHLRFDHRDVGRSLNNLAFLLLDARVRTDETLREAEANFREALALFRSLHGDEPHVEVAACMTNLARCLGESGRAAEARELLLAALDVKRATLPTPHRSLANTLHELGRIEIALDMPQEARHHLEEALEQRRAIMAPDHPDVTTTEEMLRSIGS